MFYRLLILYSMLLYGCGTEKVSSVSNAASPGKPIVVCTTGMIADATRVIAGDLFFVDQLMGEGVDPHLYKPSPLDQKKLSHAELILHQGLHLEANMHDLLHSLSHKKRVVAISEDLLKTPEKLIRLNEAEASGHTRVEALYDPHIWFDVALWSECMPPIAAELARLAPEHKTEIEQRLIAYQTELKQLDTYCETELATIPEPQRVLMTSHDAFHYFSRRYHVDVLAIQGVSTQSEASLSHINELVDTLIKRKINAVFMESTISERTLRALTEGCHQHGHTVKIGGPLYTDAMGPVGSDAEHYLGMMKYNVQEILRGLK
jgi:manganese/zinc/iron transport system substrate-binding protein